MRRGVCVKCGAATVRAARNGVATGEHHEALLRPHLGPDFRGAVRRQAADLWGFACTTCGYVELHLLDPKAIAYINENWIEVPQPPPADPPRP